MLLTNPKIDGTQTSVPAIINAIPRKNPTKVTVNGTIPIPPWKGGLINDINRHYQGVAPFNGSGTDGPDSLVVSGCISASSTVGYFSGFAQLSGQAPAVKSVVVPDTRYYHAAGMQMLGDLLVVSLESDHGENGLVLFYNVGNLGLPVYLYSLTMPATKASAVGITTYTDSSGVEQCLLVVYEYDNRWMYIYQAPASGIATGGWKDVKPAYRGDDFDGDQFQNFALVTQKNSTGDVVYLLGFRENEELVLYTVAPPVGLESVQFTNVETYPGWSGSQWRYGMGLQIVGTKQMRLFGTSKDPSGDSDYPDGPADYSFEIYVYGS